MHNPIWRQGTRTMKTIPAIWFLVAALVTNVTLAADAPKSQKFDSNGVKIHYTVEGKGEPVVLIHGYAVNIAWNWSGVMGLSDSYQLIALDNRGHGKSDKPHDAAAYDPGVMAGDTIRLL